MIIATISDARYLTYVRALINSALANYPEAHIDLTLVNVETKWETNHPNVWVHYINNDFKGSTLEAFCTCFRANIIDRLFKEGTDNVWWLDASSIIRKPCQGLDKLLDGYDVAARNNKGFCHWMGTIGFAHTPIVGEFISKWKQYVESNQTWFSDQMNFDKTMLEFSGKIRFKDLPETYQDFSFSDSIIWKGKGHSMRGDKRWKNEMAKYGVAWENDGTNPDSLSIKQNGKKEAHYWIRNKKKIKDRGDRLSGLISKYVPSEAYNVVADIGCGPRGGIFEVNKYLKMYAVDPLWRKYEKNKVDTANKAVVRVCDTAENFKLSELADLIVSINALDHSGNIYKSIHNIWCNTKDGGIFFLHLHLRTKKELDEIHKMELTESMMGGLLAPFKILKSEVFEHDFLYEKDKATPRMFVALMRKQ